jgi:NADH-quinone oxidoreductase subunit L
VEQIVIGYAFFLEIIDVIFAITGLGLAFLLFGPKRYVKGRISQRPSDQLNEIFKTGFYLDHLYLVVVVRPFGKIAHFLWKKVDVTLVDGAMRGIGNALFSLSTILRFWSTGRLSAYLGMLFLGFAVILCGLLFGIFI